MFSPRAVRTLAFAAALNAVFASAQMADVPTTDIAALKATLYDVGTKPDQREQAAQRLLSRPDPAARALLRDALYAVNQPPVQLAAAKALAMNTTPDPTCIDPLFSVLDATSSDALITASASALSAYKNNSDVLTRLIARTKVSDDRVRVAAISAIGTFTDKRVGETLVPLVEPTQPPAVVTEASKALAYLTGMPASTDAAGWRAWWDANKGKTDAAFQADLAPLRSARFDQTQRRTSDLEVAFSKFLTDAYDKAPRDQKPDVLLGYLRSPEPSARVVGCRIAQQAAESDVTPPMVREQLRQLIGDASPEVRRRAAMAIAVINDADAVVPLLTQLMQETDTTVRAALADALRPTLDLRAVPVLVKLLDDPSVDTARTGAESLAEVGDRLRQSNPALAEKTAAKLMAVMAARTKPQNNIDLRNALVQAVAPLKSEDRSVQMTLRAMLDTQAEDRKVRRSVLNAVGQYKNPEFADTIAQWINDQSDPATRLVALRALGESAADFGAFESRLKALIDPKKEPQPEIRDAAWKVLTVLFTKAPSSQLVAWELYLKDDPAKLLVLLTEERSRFERAGDANNVAYKNQQIGDAASRPDVGRYDEAIKAYSDALDFYRANGQVKELLPADLVKAYLRAGKFSDGVQFAQKEIVRDRLAEGNIGPVLRREAEWLVNDKKQYDDGNQLIDLVLKMSPGLSPKFVVPLQDLQAQVKNRNNPRNQAPFGQPDQVQTALAW